ncbi:NAD(P)H-dependent oxidoreductase subunit E [Candidatus Haliotispira prima]|uniref:NAD(P)H-dependent oxidoreductase subunit E n=1 Tax=Candidatus Haliotispira prima TaxID=3034016 RepID=A0ABY8MJ05_9SPIO|nr:NAD(P)H-dependent oxidoreductase subunit E [Candidatus Haliotispira prima]
MKDSILRSILAEYPKDRAYLIDILVRVQEGDGHISDQSVQALAEYFCISPLDVKETISFYHFLHQQPTGKHIIYVADTVIARMNGYDAVLAALEQETGCALEETSADGLFSLFETACIGLSDQEPAILIDMIPFTQLTPAKVKSVIAEIRNGKTAEQITNPQGIDKTSLGYIENLVKSNIQECGPVFFSNKIKTEQILGEVCSRSPDDVISELTNSQLRGRGGAGFMTGLKWDICRRAEGEEKVIICNADEGEPGTFKDRVLLTKAPEQVILGMLIASYSVGATEGILYLRYEYNYLHCYLENILSDMRTQNLLGKNILGKKGFDFDIRVHLGAGAYICGDESALIESCEGKRGTPRVKPPFPVQKGYKGKPTIVNNVETFANVGRISEKGVKFYLSLGTANSSGTRLISVSGDVRQPGIYEIEWGITLDEVLEKVGAVDPKAVQISGPSGECVSAKLDGKRVFSYQDLSCNGSLMVFNSQRDILDIVRHYMQFFVNESCGICVPCRVGNVELLKKIQLFVDGKAVENDIEEIISWSKIVRSGSRCGLGTTSPKSIMQTIDRFPEIYRSKTAKQEGPLLRSFSLDEALEGYEKAKRELMPN